MLLRLPVPIAEELELAAYNEDESVTELLIQGAVIRMRMPGKEKLPALLEKLGYQPRPRPGRPRLGRGEAGHVNGSDPGEPAGQVAPEPATAAAEASPPVPPEGKDRWNLDDVSS